MAAVSEKAPGLFAGEAAEDRMHAFEASLFMIGYDVSCLKGNAPGAGIDERQRKHIQRAGAARLRRDHAGLPRTLISTLNGKTPNISYAGNVHIGFSGDWSETPFTIDSDFLQDLLNDFPAGAEAGLGANMTGDVEPDTLGYWINQHYRPSRAGWRPCWRRFWSPKAAWNPSPACTRSAYGFSERSESGGRRAIRSGLPAQTSAHNKTAFLEGETRVLGRCGTTTGE